MNSLFASPEPEPLPGGVPSGADRPPNARDAPRTKPWARGSTVAVVLCFFGGKKACLSETGARAFCSLVVILNPGPEPLRQVVYQAAQIDLPTPVTRDHYTFDLWTSIKTPEDTQARPNFEIPKP